MEEEIYLDGDNTIKVNVIDVDTDDIHEAEIESVLYKNLASESLDTNKLILDRNRLKVNDNIQMSTIDSYLDCAMPPEGNIKFRNYRIYSPTFVPVRMYSPTGDINTTPKKNKIVSKFELIDDCFIVPQERLLDLINFDNPHSHMLEEIIRPMTTINKSRKCYNPYEADDDCEYYLPDSDQTISNEENNSSLESHMYSDELNFDESDSGVIDSVSDDDDMNIMHQFHCSCCELFQGNLKNPNFNNAKMNKSVKLKRTKSAPNLLVYKFDWQDQYSFDEEPVYYDNKYFNESYDELKNPKKINEYSISVTNLKNKLLDDLNQKYVNSKSQKLAFWSSFESQPEENEESCLRYCSDIDVFFSPNQLARIALEIEEDSAIVVQESSSDLIKTVDRLENNLHEMGSEVEQMRTDLGDIKKSFQTEDAKITRLIEDAQRLRAEINDVKYLDDLINMLQGQFDQIALSNWPFKLGNIGTNEKQQNLII